MSTWLYLRCEDHAPPLVSEGESGQHLSDLDVIRDDLANRDRAQSWVDLDYPGVHHFRRNTFNFLLAHRECRIAIVDEYGRDHPTAATKEDA